MKKKPAATTHTPPTSDEPGTLPPDASRRAPTADERFTEWEESKIIALLKEIGGSAQITLQRRHPSGGMPNWSYTGTPIPVDGFSTANVASMFGGGDYRARVRTSNGQIARDFSFSVDHSIPPKNPMGAGPEKEKPERVDVAAIIREIHSASPKADNSVLMAMMAQNTQIITAALARPEPKPDPAIANVMGQVVGLVEKLSNRLDRLEKGIADAQRPAPTLDEEIEKFERMSDLLGRGEGGKEKPGSFWQELGKGLGEAVVPMLKQHFAGGGGPPMPGQRALPQPSGASTMPPPASPQPINVTTSSEPAAPTAPPDDMQNPLVTAALRRFRTAALDAGRRGSDAYEFTDNTLAVVPDNYLGRIYEAANSPDWFARIFGADADALQQTPFLTQVRDAVLSKAFVAHVLRCVQQGNITAEDAAKAFLGWNARDFDDALLGLADDRDVWADAFRGLNIDPAWLEQVRAAVVAELGAAPEPNVVEMPPGVTGPGAPSAPAAQPAPVNSRAAPTAAAAQKKTRVGK